MKSHFDVQVVEGHRVLRCHGPIDLATRAQFLYELWGLSVSHDRSLVVDLTDASYLDSGGVEGLCTLGGLLEQGRALTVVCPAGAVREALTFMDFDRTYLVVDTLGSFAAVSRIRNDESAD